MFAKLAIVVNVLVYIVDINIVVYVMCGVVCCVVLFYLQASVAESRNIRATMPLLKVAVVKRKRSVTSLASEDAPVLSADGVTCLANLDGHFKEIDGLGMSVAVQA